MAFGTTARDGDMLAARDRVGIGWNRKRGFFDRPGVVQGHFAAYEHEGCDAEHEHDERDQRSDEIASHGFSPFTACREMLAPGKGVRCSPESVPRRLADAARRASARTLLHSALPGIHGGLRAIADIEFAEHVADVRLHGFLADAETLGNLLVAEAFGDQRQNL